MFMKERRVDGVTPTSVFVQNLPTVIVTWKLKFKQKTLQALDKNNYKIKIGLDYFISMIDLVRYATNDLTNHIH